MAFAIIFSFVVLRRFLSSAISSILHFFRGDGEVCSFCHNKHSLVTIETETEHKKVCQKCGFSVIVSKNDDSNADDNNSYDNTEDNINRDKTYQSTSYQTRV